MATDRLDHFLAIGRFHGRTVAQDEGDKCTRTPRPPLSWAP
ncbi:hypothetical protein [Kocuria rosea]|nr:hypothetical protein [Kocuria rosea]